MTIKCSICKKNGHNKLSCPENTILELTVERRCPICFTNITKNKGFVKTPCKHTFCYKCFMEWARGNNNCPLCRKVIKKSDLSNIVEVEVEVEVEVPVEIIRTRVKIIEIVGLEKQIMYILIGIVISILYSIIKREYLKHSTSIENINSFESFNYGYLEYN